LSRPKKKKIWSLEETLISSVIKRTRVSCSDAMGNQALLVADENTALHSVCAVLYWCRRELACWRTSSLFIRQSSLSVIQTNSSETHVMTGSNMHVLQCCRLTEQFRRFPVSRVALQPWNGLEMCTGVRMGTHPHRNQRVYRRVWVRQLAVTGLNARPPVYRNPLVFHKAKLCRLHI